MSVQQASRQDLVSAAPTHPDEAFQAVRSAYARLSDEPHPARRAAGLQSVLDQYDELVGPVRDPGELRDFLSEATAAARQLTEQEPQTPPSLLARVLVAAAREEDVESPTTTLGALDEAVLLCRSGLDDDPETFRPLLADALEVAADVLEATGRMSEADGAVTEAVSLRRAHAEAVPGETPEAALARTLSHAGAMLTRRYREGGREATREGVDILRRLADAAEPELGRRCRQALAATLTRVSQELLRSGDAPASLEVLDEAAALQERLVEEDPYRALGHLAAVHAARALSLRAGGRLKEAVAANADAVVVLRDMAAERPLLHAGQYPTTLTTLGVLLATTGRPTEGLTALEQAGTLAAELAADRPRRFAPVLAAALSTRAVVAHDTGDGALAARVLDEGLALARERAAAHPEAYLPVVAQLLTDGSMAEATAGELGQGEEKLREALAIYEDLVAQGELQHLAALRHTLTQLYWLQTEGMDQAEDSPEVRRLAARLEAVQRQVDAAARVARPARRRWSG